MSAMLFASAIMKGKPIDVFNHGRMQRDFTYIDDIVEGVIRVTDTTATSNADWSGDVPDPATSKSPYRLYNIGNNSPVQLGRMIEVLEETLGRTAEKRMLDMQPGDVAATYADVDDLERDVGFRPATSIEEGVRRFVDWYLSYYGATPLAATTGR
jgi:UDP-glucuronate 4-epimerase